jgi:predicted amidophosphoribosyltransferase
MQAFVDLKESRVHVCLKCGSFFVQRSLFCRPCYAVIRDLYSYPYLSERSQPLKTQFLLYWEPQQSDSVSFLLRQLKDHRQSVAWRFYAEDFWQAYLQKKNFEIKPQTLLVPSPSKSPLEVDHAYLFCQALSEVSGIEMLPLLRRDSKNYDQKKKSKKQRKEITLYLREKISPSIFEKRHIILVDDILTTGETAKAASKALRGSLSFEAWVLAYRSTLGCGTPLNLL